MFKRTKQQAVRAQAKLDLDYTEDIVAAADALHTLWWKLPPGEFAKDIGDMEFKLRTAYEAEVFNKVNKT